MGMDLSQGGHLSHGSSVNRSGKLYKAIHFNVDPQTEQINYEKIEALAQEHKPKIIIAGYSSYPWVPDWARFRAIADSVGALLLADISPSSAWSPAGHPPVGMHILHDQNFSPWCRDPDGALARRWTGPYFPASRAGRTCTFLPRWPCTSNWLKLTDSAPCRSRSTRTLSPERAAHKRGLRAVFGGSDTHLTNIDRKTIVGPMARPSPAIWLPASSISSAW
jgi:glycine hydroxymethyltransferase